MDFREYAARETSETVGNLVAEVSRKVTGDLQALREAFDMVTAALDTALANQSNPDCAQDVTALAERLAAEAGRQAEAAGEQVRAEAQAVIDELRANVQAQSTDNAALTAALEKARTELARVRSDLDAETALTEAARAECAAAHEGQKRAEAAGAEIQEKARRESDRLSTELAALREQLEATRAESLRLGAQRDADAAQSEKMAAALSAVTTDLQEARTQGRKLVAEAKTAATELDALKRANDEHERAGRALQEKLDEANTATAALGQRAQDAEAEAARLRAEVEAARQASEQAARAVEEAEARAGRLLAEQADTIRKHAGSFISVSLERLLAMYLRVAKGATLDEALEAVVDALASQFPRVALFRVQNNRLEGMRQVGFDVQGDISQVLLPRTRDSLITQAVTSANIETRSGRELADTSGMPFGGTPQFGLALPLVVDGECLAVAYADDSGQADGEFARSDLRERFARLLQCQAVPLLARLAAEAKMLAELDEYAGLLLTELEQTHAEEVAAGVADAERRKNLKENIEYARRMYAQRAESEGKRAAAMFERRLFAAVESQADTPFVRDIVAVVGGRKRAARAAREAAGSGA